MSTDLFSWITGRDAWQQEIMLRVCESGRLTESELAEVRAMVEQAQGGVVEGVKPPRLVERAHLFDRSAAAPPTALLELGPVAHVDRLTPGQRPILFSAVGVTLIYGNNGSGKSGYCRIAKALCRCVHKGELRGNAYAARGPVPEVTLAFRAGNQQPVRQIWRGGDPPPAELARLSVFDGDAARIYVDGERKVEFLPHDIDLLNRFTRVLDELAQRFRAEEAPLQSALSGDMTAGYTKGSPIYAMIERIRIGATLPEEVDLRKLGMWDGALQQRLTAAQDAVLRGAAVVAKERRDLARRIRGVLKPMDDAAKLLGASGVAALVRLREEAERAREVASVRAVELFSRGAPVGGVGGEAWRRMLIYARQFAAEMKPDEATSLAGGEVCVLCQQSLDDDATARMARFDAYLEERAAQDAEEAKSAYVDAARAIRAIVLPVPDEVASLVSTLAAAAEGDRAALAGQMAALDAGLRENFRAVAAAIDANDLAPLASLAELPPYPDAASLLEALEAEANDLDARAKSEDTGGLRRTYDELHDRKKLSDEIETMCTRRSQLAKLRHLSTCKNACDTTAATRQVGKLRQILLTTSLADNLRAEVEAFDLTHLPLKVQERGRRGDTMIQIDLQKHQSVKLGEVLSEGEQRALALAGFLAELKEVGGGHGVIIDDPVSSLDHTRIEAVARRLVEEGRTRQVIIFTHNLVFHHSVAAFAEEQGVKLHCEYVARRGDDQFGIVDQAESPWIMKKVGQRLEGIGAEIRRMEPTFDRNSESCRPDVRNVYSMIRETWERLIEEVLFADVVNRFRKDVQTTRLQSAFFDKADFAEVQKGMTRVSRFTGHDTAAGGIPDLPTMAEMRTDLGDLRACYDRTSKRAKELKKAAEATKGPPPPDLIEVPDGEVSAARPG